MAWIIETKQKMANMLDHFVSELQAKQAAMLILPLLAVETEDDLSFVLAQQLKFIPTDSKSTNGRKGTLRLSKTKSVMDALHELSNSGMLDVHVLQTAFDCRVEQDKIATTTVAFLQTPMGNLYVDVSAFAQRTGLPLVSVNKNDYAVFVYPVTNLKYPDYQGKVLVAIQEERKEPDPCQTDADSVSSLLPKLQERTPFDVAYVHKFPEITDGWQLQAHPRFNELLSWLRPGYGYVLAHNENVLTMIY